MADKQKLLILTSTSIRHDYLTHVLRNFFDVQLVVREEKGSYYQSQQEKSVVIQSHMEELCRVEKLYFKEVDVSELNTVSVKRGAINSPDLIKLAASFNPDMVAVFGTSILNRGWLEQFDKKLVNLHLGLSPFYRGSATLFWPFVFNELHYVGSTFHLVEEDVDSGDVIKRFRAKFEEKDSYYDIINKTIKQSIEIFPAVLSNFSAGTLTAEPQVQNQGRVFKKSDFNETVLKKVLSDFSSGLEKHQLDELTKVKI